jgi:hypothetical protein
MAGSRRGRPSSCCERKPSRSIFCPPRAGSPFERFQRLAAPFPSHCNSQAAGAFQACGHAGPRRRGFGAGRAFSRAWATKPVTNSHSLSLKPQPWTRRHCEYEPGLVGLSEKQYPVRVGLARNCRFFSLAPCGPVAMLLGLDAKRNTISASPHQLGSSPGGRRLVRHGEDGARRGDAAQSVHTQRDQRRSALAGEGARDKDGLVERPA